MTSKHAQIRKALNLYKTLTTGQRYLLHVETDSKGTRGFNPLARLFFPGQPKEHLDILGRIVDKKACVPPEKWSG